MKRKTHEEFIKQLSNLIEDEYKILGEYVTSKEKIKIKHVLCGCEWFILPNNFLKGKRCPKCAGKLRDTIQFKQEVNKLTNGEYELLGEYNKWNIKTLLKHKTCGFKYETTPNIFLSGSRCPKCAGNLKYNQDSIKKEIYSLVGNEYEILEKYINNRTKIKMIHNKCGHVWNIAPDSFLSGTRCPVCQHRSYKKSNDEFILEIFNLVGNEYMFLNEYINNETKIKVKHVKCNFEYKVKPSKFLLGQRCPNCNISKGEFKISKILKNKNICLILQHTFANCKNINMLEFDFYLPDYNICIEYQGIQHYEPVDFAGKGEEWAIGNFNLIQMRDQIKRNYCETNNIKLIEIPYWDFNNIENIINSITL